MARVKLGLVQVRILALDGKALTGASAALEPLVSDAQGPIVLEFDPLLDAYTAGVVSPGSYILAVSAGDLESQRRQVEVAADGLEETVILGQPGLPYYYRGTVKVPYEDLKLIAVSLSGPLAEANRKAKELAERFHLEAVPEKSILDALVHVFRVLDQPGLANAANIVIELYKEEGVRHAGPVVASGKNSVAFVTTEFIVKFKPSVEPDGAIALARRFELTVRRAIGWAGNAFLVQARDPWTGLRVCDRLRESGMVEYAEPNLVVTARDDQVNATDFLVPQQWHIPHVELPGAWACLRALNGPGVVPGNPGDLTFGSENITIAVFDRGIPSRTDGGVVQPIHADFDGNVTSGAPKIAAFFDFSLMSPDNDVTSQSHGINCGGIAAALANNPPAVVGDNEGVVGAAPNCRVLAIVRPDAGTELQYYDAYLWMAGLDPESDQAGFPEALPAEKRADVISNSFGASANAPISGLMKTCFDRLTTEGRGGRGVVLCFSTSNDDQEFELIRPWAAYAKNIAVGASTQLDTKAVFSGFGANIDLCAPGENLVTCDREVTATIAGRSGAVPAYVMFSGTSASTPLVAGIAALVLSAAPDLTWSEVRDILCDTAVRIDYANADPIGHWTDSDGDTVDDFSKWYGYGRVNAKAAVVAAIARRQGTTTAAPSAPTGLRTAQ